MYHDVSGDRIVVSHDAARLAWNDTLESLLSHASTTPEHLNRTLVIDPDFSLAHAAKGLMLLSLARRDLLGAARASVASAKVAMARRPITARERMTVEALELWLSDAPRAAAQRLEAILETHPLDVLALKLSQGLRFMLGDQAQMLAQLRRIVPVFADTHPLAGYVNGCYAFALEERGFYAAAERVGRHAVALSPRDAWGRHAVAHVMEMTGRAKEGIAWLSDRRCWAHANNLRFHIVWHIALFQLERGDNREALRLYDEEIRNEPTDDFRDLANGASLLARFEYAGIDVGSRWEELASHAQNRMQDRCLVFADLHYALSLLGAGQADDAEAIARALVDDSRTHPSSERRKSARIGALAAFGLIAFREGDYVEASRLLGAARERLVTIGGSHAQRDLFEQAYIESLIRCEYYDLAASTLGERISHRGTNTFAARRLAILQRGLSGQAAAMAVAATSIPINH